MSLVQSIMTVPPPAPKTSIGSRHSRSRTNSTLSVHGLENRNRRLRRLSGASQRSTTSSQLSQSEQLQQPLPPAWATGDSFDVYCNSPEPELSPAFRPDLSGPHLETNLHLEPSPFGSPYLSAENLSSLSLTSAPTQFDLSKEFDPNHPSDLQDMSSLGVMIPAQFGTPYGHSFESSNFMMDHSSGTHQQHHSRTSSSTPAYAASYSSSPALLATSPSMSDRRQSGVNPQSSVPSYSSRSVPIGAYEVPQGLMQSPPAASAYPPVSSVAPSVFNLPAPSPSSYPPPQQAPVHGQIGGYPYGHSFSSSPGQYAPPTYDIPYSQAPAPLYVPSSNASYPPPYLASSIPESAAGSMPPGSAPGETVRVLNSRPKPQCWEHGCNGRQFSTFSNLLRHQREKSGTAAKSYCPRCGAEFTRTTARNGHMAHEKCKPRRTSQENE